MLIRVLKPPLCSVSLLIQPHVIITIITILPVIVSVKGGTLHCTADLWTSRGAGGSWWLLAGGARVSRGTSI
jgi:hypothetical protein